MKRPSAKLPDAQFKAWFTSEYGARISSLPITSLKQSIEEAKIEVEKAEMKLAEAKRVLSKWRDLYYRCMDYERAYDAALKAWNACGELIAKVFKERRA